MGGQGIVMRSWWKACCCICCSWFSCYTFAKQLFSVLEKQSLELLKRLTHTANSAGGTVFCHLWWHAQGAPAGGLDRIIKPLDWSKGLPCLILLQLHLVGFFLILRPSIFEGLYFLSLALILRCCGQLLRLISCSNVVSPFQACFINCISFGRHILSFGWHRCCLHCCS